MKGLRVILYRLADCGPSLLVKLGVLLILTTLLRKVEALRDVMKVLLGLLILSMLLLAPLTLLVRAWRKDHETEEEGSEDEVLSFIPSGQKPGLRSWKHDVYDENAYAILGVPQNATRAEIREAFRKLVQKYHPDAVPAEEKECAALVFVRLDQAYELLTHPENRARYDAWIEHLGGREPILDLACEQFKNSETLAQFDANIRPHLLGLKKGQESEEGAKSAQQVRTRSANQVLPGTTPSFSPNSKEIHNQALACPSSDSGDSPPEVDIPEAIREILGLANAFPFFCGRCARPLEQGKPGNDFCERCRLDR
jgi:curved DNA-binding protein CbpA